MMSHGKAWLHGQHATCSVVDKQTRIPCVLVEPFEDTTALCSFLCTWQCTTGSRIALQVSYLSDVGVPIQAERHHKVLRNRLPVHIGVRRQMGIIVAHSACHFAHVQHLSSLHTNVPWFSWFSKCAFVVVKGAVHKPYILLREM